MKKLILTVAILATYYCNAQKLKDVSIKFDVVMYDKGVQILTLKPDGTLVVKDSLIVIKALLRELTKAQKEREFLAREIFEYIIKQQKTINKTKQP